MITTRDRGFRRLAIDFAKSTVRKPWFEPFIVGVIVFNAGVLGLQTDPSFNARYGGIADALDKLVLGVFIVELGLKLTAYGSRFFRSGWNWFDLIVVLISIMPATSSFSILRAARILRLLRLISIVPKMRRVIGGFFAALPGMAGVVGVLAIIFYVSAVAATTVFGQMATAAPLPEGATPEDAAAVEQLFGSLGRSIFTLFQLMTLENWVDGIVTPTLKIFPNALWFFIPFIVLTSFAVLNLFIGIIVDSMQDEQREEQAERDADQDAAREEFAGKLLAEIRALRVEVAELKEARAPDAGAPREERARPETSPSES